MCSSPLDMKRTFHQEQAVPHHQEKQEKGLTSNALHCHMEKWEAEKQEVLRHQQCYICHRCWEIKLTLHQADEVVREFKVFGDNAQIYATYVMAMLEWGLMHCHYGRRDPVSCPSQVAHHVHRGFKRVKNECRPAQEVQFRLGTAMFV